MFYFSGDLQQSAELAAQSVDTSERAQDDVEWRIVAAQYELLAITSAQTGQMERAKASASTAKKLRAEYFSADHPDAVLADHAEAMVMMEEGRYPEALERLERVFEHRHARDASIALDIHEPLIHVNLLTGQTQRVGELCRMLQEDTDLQSHPHKRFAIRVVEHCSAVM
jgi:predicted Zn-dependent protease